MYAHESFAVRTVCKDGNDDTVMALRREVNLNVSFFKTALNKGKSAGGVVGGNNHKGLSVFLCPLKYVTDYFVELEVSLKEKLGRKVKVEYGKNKGALILEFYDKDDLKAIADMLYNEE